MKFFAFVAGFFRNAASESSTRLVGILACVAGLLLAGALVVWARVTKAPITAADIVMVFGVFAYSCTALGLRSPFPAELFAPPGSGIAQRVTVEETTQTATKIESATAPT